MIQVDSWGEVRCWDQRDLSGSPLRREGLMGYRPILQRFGFDSQRGVWEEWVLVLIRTSFVFWRESGGGVFSARGGLW